MEATRLSEYSFKMYAKDFMNEVATSSKYCLVCSSPVEGNYNASGVNVSIYLKVICEVIGLANFEIEAIIQKQEKFVSQINFCAECRRNLDMVREISCQIQSLSLQICQIKDTLSESLCNVVDAAFEDSTCLLRTILVKEYDSRNTPKLKLVNPESILEQDYCNSPLHSPITIAETEITSIEDATKIIDKWSLKPCQVNLELIEDVEESGKIYYDDEQRRKIRLQELLERQEAKLMVTTNRNRQRKTKNILKPELAPIAHKIQSKSKSGIKCPQCRQHRHTEEMLRFHFRRMHEGKTAMYNCFNCDAEYWLLQDLRYHEAETGHYTPNSQGVQSTRKKASQKHEKSMANGGRIIPTSEIKCAHCYKRFQNEELLRFHVHETHEGRIGMYDCFNCDDEIKLPEQLRHHETETGRFTPRLAANSVRKKANRKKETGMMISGKRNRTPEIKCLQCQQRCETAELLRFHVREIHESKTAIYNCFNCDAEFELLEHLRNHQTETGHCTPISQKVNSTKKTGKRSSHEYTETGDKAVLPSDFNCSQCQQHRQTEELLRFHVRKIHEGRTAIYDCFNCEAEFELLQHLRNHQTETGHCTLISQKVNSTKKTRKSRELAEIGDKIILASDFKCPQCQQHRHTEELLRFHVRRIHERKTAIYNCFNCDEEFDQLVKLRYHETETGHHTPNTQRLSCAKKGPNPNAEKHHNTTAKKIKIEQGFKCFQCGECRQTEELLRFHVRTHEEKLPYNCFNCAAEFEVVSELRTHEDETGHRTPISNVDKVECKTCRREFLPQNYEAHLERQGGECKRLLLLPLNGYYDKSQNKSQRYVCRECGKKFRYPNHLDLHVRGSHTDGFAFMCEYCSKTFKSKKSLNQHQQQLHLEQLLDSKAQADIDAMLPQIEKRRCQICKITLTTIEAKRVHDRRHTDDYKYQCEVCGSGWMTLASLKHHSRTHIPEKKHKCHICNHQFSGAQKRDIHMRSKHGIGDLEKKFKCDLCEKTFWNIHKMQQHTKLMHTNYKKGQSTIPLEFGCDICDYTCAIRDYLIIHSRTKKHLQNIKDRGLTDIKSGLRFPEPRYKTSN